MRTIVLDGIGSSEGVNSTVVTTIADRLAERADTTTTFINWQAGMVGVGAGGSWRDNSREAVQMIIDDLATHDDDVILIGFSGGNKPVHDFLLKHPEYHDRVAAVGLVADPWRPRDRWQHGLRSPEPRYGIMGERHTPIPDRVLWTTVKTDPISSAYPDALLRYLADTSDGDMDQIIHKGIEHGHLGTFQLAWQLGVIQREPLSWLFGLPGRVGQLAADVRAYMDGSHTAGYIRPYRTAGGDQRSLAVRLADSLAWMVTKP